MGNTASSGNACCAARPATSGTRGRAKWHAAEAKGDDLEAMAQLERSDADVAAYWKFMDAAFKDRELKRGVMTCTQALKDLPDIKQDELFDKYDEDHSGALDKSELLKAFKELSIASTDATPFNAEQIAKGMMDMVDTVDTDGDGEIDYREFCAFLCGADRAAERAEAREAAARDAALAVSTTPSQGLSEMARQTADSKLAALERVSMTPKNLSKCGHDDEGSPGSEGDTTTTE
eukprot:COSAG06_NODE_879_length_11805_cov_73.994020_3_plen_234_part_00